MVEAVCIIDNNRVLSSSFFLLFQDFLLFGQNVLLVLLFRWFKFTLKPPYTVANGNFLSAIWGTSHWTSFVKFGLKTA